MSSVPSDKEIHDELEKLKSHIKETYWDKGVRLEAEIIKGLEAEQYAVSANELKQVIHELGGAVVAPNNAEATPQQEPPQTEPKRGPVPKTPMIVPPLDEIDDLLRTGYTVAQVEAALRTKYHTGFRSVVNSRRKLALEAAAKNASPTPTATEITRESSPVTPSTPTQAPQQDLEQAVANLKSELGVDFSRGGSGPMSTPSSVDPAVQAAKIRNFNAMVSIMKKTGQPYDAAMLASSLGYFDLAQQVRDATQQGQLTQLLAQYSAQGTNESVTPAVVAGGSSNLIASLEGMLNKAFEIKMMSKLLGPILSNMDDKPASSGQDNPEVRLLREQIAKMENDRRFDELSRKIEVQGSGSKTSGESELLKYQLETLKTEKASLAQATAQEAQLRFLKDLTTSKDANATDIFTKFQGLQAETQKALDLERMRHEQQERELASRERETYNTRLHDLEDKLDKAQSAGGSNSYLEQYHATRALVRDEMKELDVLRGNQTGGTNVPEILKDLAHEFAPAVTEAVRARTGTAAPPGPARQGVQGAGMLTGNCPYCGKQVNIPDVDQTPCPECGQIISPRGRPQQPQTVTATPPMAPQPMTPEMTQGPFMGEERPRPAVPYDSPVVNGQVVRPRRPDEPVLA